MLYMRIDIDNCTDNYALTRIRDGRIEIRVQTWDAPTVLRAGGEGKKTKEEKKEKEKRKEERRKKEKYGHVDYWHTPFGNGTHLISGFRGFSRPSGDSSAGDPAFRVDDPQLRVWCQRLGLKFTMTAVIGVSDFPLLCIVEGFLRF